MHGRNDKKMRYILLLFIIFIISCGYPDIDSVPNFDDVKLSNDELKDLCDMNSKDNIKELCED